MKQVEHRRLIRVHPGATAIDDDAVAMLVERAAGNAVARLKHDEVAKTTALEIPRRGHPGQASAHDCDVKCHCRSPFWNGRRSPFRAPVWILYARGPLRIAPFAVSDP